MAFNTDTECFKIVKIKTTKEIKDITPPNTLPSVTLVMETAKVKEIKPGVYEFY